MSANRTSRILPVLGGIGLGVGVIGAYVAKEAADSHARVEQFSASFDNRLIDFAPDYTLMWVAIVVAALGVIALIAHFATRGNAETAPPQP